MATVQTGIATEFINFTRASNATVTDSNGVIKWAAHNLLTNSESFDAAAWGKTSVTVTGPNAAVAPNGTTTADTITLGAGTASKFLSRTLAAVDAQCTLGLYVKIASGTVRYIQLLLNGDVQAYANFDITGNAVGTKGTNTPNSAITSLGSDWYYISATFTGAGNNPLVQVVDGASAGYSPSTSATGTFHLWGAHLYRSDLGGMQPNTSAYPMYNPTTPKNLLGYTEDFSNAYWTKFRSSIGVSTTAPNGLQTADKLVPQNGLASGGIYNTACAVVAGGSYTASVYAKAAELGFVFVVLNVRGSSTSQAVCVNLATGARSNEGASGTYSAVDAGNGWWRISCTGPATNTIGYLEVYPLAAAGSVNSYTGDGTSGIYIWGAQLSDSASLDSYSPVYGAAVTSAAYYGPRRDFDGATLACKGLLVEEQRTNLLLYSAAFDNVYWTPFDVVVSGAAIASPAGSTTTNKIVPNSTSAVHAIRSSSISSGGSRVISVYVYPDGFTKFAVQENYGQTSFAAFDCTGAGSLLASAGGGSGATIVKLASGWYRVTMPATQATNYTAAFFVLPDSYTSGSIAGSWSGDGVKGIYLWGAQTEDGAFPTSYIPTGASTVTRSADVASVSTQAFPYSATEGTVVVNASSPCIAAIANMITLDNGTTQERIRLLTDVASVKTIVTESNTTQANLSPGSATANTPFKFAVAYKVNDFAAVVNGSAAATDAAGNVPVVNIARFGADSSGNYLNGHIRQITYLPRRISNTELQQRTS